MTIRKRAASEEAASVRNNKHDSTCNTIYKQTMMADEAKADEAEASLAQCLQGFRPRTSNAQGTGRRDNESHPYFNL